MKASVYYWTRYFSQALLEKTPTREIFDRYYCKICEVEGDNEITPEDIFDMLNTNEVLKTMLQFKAVVIGHTSMSVGDIVEIDGKYYICRNIGWEEVFMGTKKYKVELTGHIRYFTVTFTVTDEEDNEFFVIEFYDENTQVSDWEIMDEKTKDVEDEQLRKEIIDAVLNSG